MGISRVAQLEPGFAVDGLYEILGKVGAGGMATVYRAVQRDTRRTVALKLIDLGDEDVSDTRRRFFNELLLATRVRHANIVSVYDFGLLPSLGTPYIVMEMLHGLNLRQHMRRFGPLLVEEALPLFLGALGALKDAHKQGVVHKDLKPSNLFLCDAPSGGDTSLVIVDFGIAVRMSDGDSEKGDYHGTPRYSPPEYITERRVGPVLDVYQMGLVFCEAVSGRPCVPATDPKECFRAHVRGDLDIPTDLLGPKLGAVMEKALARAPSDRYQNAGELYEAFLRAAGDEAGPTFRRLEAEVAFDSETTEQAARKVGIDPSFLPPSSDDEGLPTGLLDWDDEDFVSAREEANASAAPSSLSNLDTERSKQVLPPTSPPFGDAETEQRPRHAVAGEPKPPNLLVFGLVIAGVCFGSGALLMWLVMG